LGEDTSLENKICFEYKFLTKEIEVEMSSRWYTNQITNCVLELAQKPMQEQTENSFSHMY